MTTGPASDTDIPDIIPIHVLERMALAYAEGTEYDISQDEEYQQRLKTKETTDVVADDVEEEFLDLGDLTFETVAGCEAEESGSGTGQPGAEAVPAASVQEDPPADEPQSPLTAAQSEPPAPEPEQDKASLSASDGNALRRGRRPAAVRPPEQKPVPLECDTRAPEERPLEYNIPNRTPSLTDIYGMPGQPLQTKESKGTGKLSSKKETRQFQKE